MNMNMDVPDELFDTLEKLAGIEVAGKKALSDAEPIVVDALKRELANHKDTGKLQESVKATGPKENAKGLYDFIRPTGKDDKGVRNMEKLAYLEYGTSKQAATPVCAAVRALAEKKVANEMENSIKRSLGL